MSSHLVGNVTRIIFANEDNDYYVLAIQGDDGKNTVVGNFASIKENHIYEFEGDFTYHDSFGEQFKAISAKLVLPEEKDAFVSYLSSAQFSGIGKAMAAKIYDLYDIENQEQNIYQRIIDDPEKLRLIKGISSNKAKLIYETLKNELQDNLLLEYLSNYNVDYAQVLKSFTKSGLSTREFLIIIQDNPYLLMLNNIGFKEIDKYAHNLTNQESTFEFNRACAFIFQKIKDLTFQSGSTYIDYAELFEHAPKYKSMLIDESVFKAILEYLTNIDAITIIDDKYIYEIEQYKNEQIIADFIKEYASIKNDKDYADYINTYETYKGINLNEMQSLAINQALNNSISIITGGPGTGKSTIVDALIYILKKVDLNQRIALCAPTGKAAKRLNDLTNMPSTTIHRLLKYNMSDQSFGHNVFNPLEYDILIIDESSMIDNVLMGNLLKACENVNKIILLGDYNQLPSVAQGQVLKDLIDSNTLNVTYLKDIYRQKSGSHIIDIAYKILQKEKLVIDDFATEDLKLINIEDKNQITKVAQDYANNLENVDSMMLAPLYRGLHGIDKINKAVQFYRAKEHENKFYEGDYVIQLKNRSDEDIYNGDVGIVEKIDGNELVVLFDDKEIIYNKNITEEIKLAYCISIHKSQGNEYDKLIIFIPYETSFFVDNKMLYTAVTRAKQSLIIISNLETLNKVMNNTFNNERKTRLLERLKNTQK